MSKPVFSGGAQFKFDADVLDRVCDDDPRRSVYIGLAVSQLYDMELAERPATQGEFEAWLREQLEKLTAMYIVEEGL